MSSKVHTFKLKNGQVTFAFMNKEEAEGLFNILNEPTSYTPQLKDKSPQVTYGKFYDKEAKMYKIVELEYSVTDMAARISKVIDSSSLLSYSNNQIKKLLMKIGVI